MKSTRLTELFLGKPLSEIVPPAAGVRAGPELLRIEALPRRVWENDPELDELIERLTDYLKLPQGRQTLRPAQAVLLKELYDHGGAFGEAAVGGGKTLCSFLAPVLLEAKRPLLLLQANLCGKYNDNGDCLVQGKTEREFDVLRQHWRSHPSLRILSYEKLSRAKQSDFLDRYQPDMIIADEAPALKDPSSGRTKRVRRYMRTFPDTIFVPLTGTPSRNSIKEYWHLSDWAMKENSPVPRTWQEIDEWSRATDAKVRDEDRLPLGALTRFGAPVRDALALRRRQTPGWVAILSTDTTAGLRLLGARFDGFPPHVDAKFRALRDSYETPDGETFVEPVKLWAYLRQCSMGFWYRYDPPPPIEWKECKKEWGSFVRGILALGRPHLDTELQVALACELGKIADSGLHAKWVKTRPMYDPEKHKKTEWFDLSFVHWCASWLEKERGVLFTPFIAFGEKLKEISGLPYFGAGGKDASAGSIESYLGGPCIASVQANFKGRNLQDRWHKALLVGGSSDASMLKQLIGRFHRSGQERDVEFTFSYGCVETLEALSKAKKEAPAADDPHHKLLVGEWLVDEEDVGAGARWEK